MTKREKGPGSRAAVKYRMRVECSRENTEVMRESLAAPRSFRDSSGVSHVQGGDSLLPQCQSGRALCCQLLFKQNTRGGNAGSPQFYFNVLPSVLTPFPLRSQPASSFISCLVLMHGEEEQTST